MTDGWFFVSVFYTKQDGADGISTYPVKLDDILAILFTLATTVAMVRANGVCTVTGFEAGNAAGSPAQ